MHPFEIFCTALGLSADAFAVSLCRGLQMKKFMCREAGILAVSFGGFQAFMPLLGWLLGKQFSLYITRLDGPLAFAILCCIGSKMIYDTKHSTTPEPVGTLTLRTLLALSLATSIDALAVGVSFACLQVPILAAACSIGSITMLVCFLGVYIGYQFGSKFKNKAEILGGVILILIGIKILLQDL